MTFRLNYYFLLTLFELFLTEDDVNYADIRFDLDYNENIVDSDISSSSDDEQGNFFVLLYFC